MPRGSCFTSLFFALFVLVDALRGRTTLHFTRASLRSCRRKQSQVLLHVWMGYVWLSLLHKLRVRS